MKRSILLAATWALLMLGASGISTAAPLYKCKVNGSVLYQQDPCPSTEGKKRQPTVEELNAERQRHPLRAAVVRALTGVQHP